MGHNNVISGHPKPIGIQRVDGLSTRPPDLERHKNKNDTKEGSCSFILGFLEI